MWRTKIRGTCTNPPHDLTTTRLTSELKKKTRLTSIEHYLHNVKWHSPTKVKLSNHAYLNVRAQTHCPNSEIRAARRRLPATSPGHRVQTHFLVVLASALNEITAPETFPVTRRRKHSWLFFFVVLAGSPPPLLGCVQALLLPIQLLAAAVPGLFLLVRRHRAPALFALSIGPWPN